MKPNPIVASLLFAASLLLAGCNYEFPLTAKATQPVRDQLMGEWRSVDTDADKLIHLNIRKLDETNYVLAYDGELYRAFHSDFAGLPLVSVQDLNSGERKYAYFSWQLSADGTRLSLKSVSTRVIPDNLKDIAAIQQLIKQNLSNPNLYGEEMVFTRKKERQP